MIAIATAEMFSCFQTFVGLVHVIGKRQTCLRRLPSYEKMRNCYVKNNGAGGEMGRDEAQW